MHPDGGRFTLIHLKGDHLSAFRNRSSRWPGGHVSMPTKGQSSAPVSVLKMGPNAAGKRDSLQARKSSRPSVYAAWKVPEQGVLSTLALPGLEYGYISSEDTSQPTAVALQ